MNVEWPPVKKWKRPRASQLDILSSCTGSAKAVGKVIPALNGKLTDSPFLVPILNLSRIGLSKNLVKLVALYGNEWGYSTRVVDLIAHMAKAQENCLIAHMAKAQEN
ncbi:hypothetical protein K1719_008847 [Acacia pycnantha]|nr:hypothetical protein K1719_008847 [Acacia pycnantha]